MTASDYLHSVRLDYAPGSHVERYLADPHRHVEISSEEVERADVLAVNRAVTWPRWPRQISPLVLAYLCSRDLDARAIGRALGVRPAGSDVAPAPLSPSEVEAHVDALLGDLAALDLDAIPLGRGVLRRWAVVAREAPDRLRRPLVDAFAVAWRDAPRWRPERRPRRASGPAMSSAERQAASRERRRREEIATATYALRLYLAAVADPEMPTDHEPGETVAVADLMAAAIDWAEEPLDLYVDAVRAWEIYRDDRADWLRRHRAYVADARKRERGGVEGAVVMVGSVGRFVLPDPVPDPGPEPVAPETPEEAAEDIGWTADHLPRDLDSLPRAALRAAAADVLGEPVRARLDDGRRALAYTLPVRTVDDVREDIVESTSLEPVETAAPETSVPSEPVTTPMEVAP